MDQTNKPIPTHRPLPAWKRIQFPLIKDNIPGIMKKGIQTDGDEKALAMEIIEQTYPHDIWTHGYTDGSTEELNRNGDGIILLNLKDGQTIQQAIPTGRYSTNYKAEGQSLKTTATMLVEQRKAIQNKVGIHLCTVGGAGTILPHKQGTQHPCQCRVCTAERHWTDSAPVDPTTLQHTGKRGGGQIGK